MDGPEPELPEPQFPELHFPELKLPTLEFSDPLANPEEIPDLPPRPDGLGAGAPSSPVPGATRQPGGEAVTSPAAVPTPDPPPVRTSPPPPGQPGQGPSLDRALATLESTVAGFNRQDVVSCARDAFTHLQAAVSLSEPERCRVYLTEEVGQAVQREVESLRARGRRRVRGNLDILDASITRVDSPERVGVRIDAVSSLCEMDEGDNVVEGSPDLMRWGRELTMSRDQAGPVDRRWLISALQTPAVGVAVTGPAAPPMDAAERSALEDHIEQLDRESDEHEADLMDVAASDLIHPGSG
ncbi:MAG: TIM44-like domain-containing protein [Candidatus Dormibacteria bacterium]